MRCVRGFGVGGWTGKYCFIADVYAEAMRWSNGKLGGPSNGAPSGPDVWIQRSEHDYWGESPLSSSEDVSASPDIWNRSTPPTQIPPTDPAYLQLENPISGQTNWMNVRLRNRGCEAGSGVLEVWWAQASTGLGWPSGSVDPNGSNWHPVGSTGTIFQIASLQPGEERIVTIPWIPHFNAVDDGHHCFIARYTSPQEPLSFYESDFYNHNEIAWKNMFLIMGAERSSHFQVNNYDSVGRNIDLEINLHQLKPVTSRLNGLGIHISLDPETYTAWMRTGFKGTGIKVNKDSSITLTDTMRATLIGIPFGVRKTAQISCHVDSLNKVSDERFYIRWSQFTQLTKPSDRRLDGGLTWDVRTKESPVIPPIKGGDSVKTDSKTAKPLHVQTYALYVSNTNKAGTSIDRVIIGLEGKAKILAVGPTPDSQQVMIGMAKNAINRRFVFTGGSENELRLYAGETFRPIYLTVATPDTGNMWITFMTMDHAGDTITNGRVFLNERLTSGVEKGNTHMLYASPSLLSCYPNPMTTLGTARFNLPESASGADLVLYDVTGRAVRTVFTNRSFGAGSHEFNFDVHDLPTGAYFLTLQAEGASYVANIQVSH
jgi:hypothetical protein